jgi:hypothetical protein
METKLNFSGFNINDDEKILLNVYIHEKLIKIKSKAMSNSKKSY